MIHTIRIGGEEREIRCDLNVLGELQRRYTDWLNALPDAVQTIEELKSIAALMVNEAAIAARSRERVTPQQIGERMTFDELREAQTAVLAAFMDCIWPGKTRKADDGTEPDEGDAAKKPMPQRTTP